MTKRDSTENDFSNATLGAALTELYATLCERKNADPKLSYSAELFSKGTALIAKKLGEEAVETALAAVLGDRHHIIEESSDLLYHLLVLWVERGINPEEIATALRARQGRSGLAEKASRDR